MIKFDDYLQEQLKNPEFKKAFDEEELFAKLAIQIAMLREQSGWSQKQLAQKLKTSQQMISRIEDPHNKSLSLYTLAKLARAFHKKLEIRIV